MQNIRGCPRQNRRSPLPCNLDLSFTRREGSTPGRHDQCAQPHGTFAGREPDDKESIGKYNLEDIPFPDSLSVKATSPKFSNHIPVASCKEKRFGVSSAAGAGLESNRGEVSLIVAKGWVDSQAFLQISLEDDRKIPDVPCSRHVRRPQTHFFPTLPIERNMVPGPKY